MFCTETANGYNLLLVANIIIDTIDILIGLLSDKLNMLELLL